MPRTLLAGFVSLLACALLAVTVPTHVGAQQSVQRASSTTAAASTEPIESFAKTHLAVSALRDHYQAQFAEPQNKKREVQDALHEKFAAELQALLKEHGFTEVEFARMTRLVSVDSTARRAFEEALARGAKKGVSQE